MDKIHALVHNNLQHGDLVEPFSDADLECFKEIREVLKKHGKLDRFGLTLLHKHFDLEEDEMLVENVDEENRIQTIAPMKKAEIEKLGGAIMETLWSLNDSEAVMGCRRACVKYGNGSHFYQHVYS